MKKKLSILLAALVAFPALAELRLEWDANDPSEEVTSYNVYSAQNVADTFTIKFSTTNTVFVIPETELDGEFFFVTAVNIVGESSPSIIASLPPMPSGVGTLRIAKSE